ncbi:hypothetical protein SAY87_029778 [Trapa incisa]|uniref:Uncharacterized protein n=1 Tax=Trapa incisa TaxID=236973 RepID=A0AAN7KBM1_9MYRT|nr:hypothetical protein SAY87_029778 [Trapa incisa]
MLLPDGTWVTTTATDSTSAHEGKLKRKKTFAELKEEESLLLKERVHLKRKLATLNAMLEKERTMNQTLKRMKLSLNTTKRKQTGKATGSGTPVPSMDKLMMSSTGEEDKSLTLLPQAAVRNYTTSDVPREPSPVEKRDTYCFLPDLNLMPSEADLCW